MNDAPSGNSCADFSTFLWHESRRFVHLWLALLAWLAIAGCSRLAPPGAGQPLVIGLPSDPVFQQLAPPTEGLEGFSRDLGNLFAGELDVEVRFVTAPDVPALLTMVREGEVHFAAAVPTSASMHGLRYTPSLRETRQVIVQHTAALPVNRPEKLAGREISVMPGAPQIATIVALGVEPPPHLVERPSLDELELLTGLARRRFDLVATDDLHYTVAANVHPELDIALVLPAQLSYVWVFHERHEALRQQALNFIVTARENHTLRRLDERYFGHIRRLDEQDIAGFLAHIRTRLPQYRHAFHDAQAITGIDWRMLAALAYQESKWDPLATSYTNVRGMMMLTEETADRMGVNNRLDALQSIVAGAKYLTQLMDDLPAEIKQPDRLWFALAAYNLGMGHLRGARRFAPGLKRDANAWMDMKEVLPLMSRPEYYTRLKSGRARGGEAVILVENIRNYFDVLSRLEPSWTPPSIALELPQPRALKSAAGRKTATPPM